MPMTPGQRRRSDRRYSRKEATKAVAAERREMREQGKELPDLRSLPHPKIPALTAWHYVEWLKDHGYSNKAIAFIHSL